MTEAGGARPDVVSTCREAARFSLTRSFPSTPIGRRSKRTMKPKWTRTCTNTRRTSWPEPRNFRPSVIGIQHQPRFVVMFLPLESLLSSALETNGLLLEEVFRNVVLATPTTILGMLRTIQFGYQRKLMADNAEEIRAAGAEMLTRLRKLSITSEPCVKA